MDVELHVLLSACRMPLLLLLKARGAHGLPGVWKPFQQSSGKPGGLAAAAAAAAAATAGRDTLPP